MVALNLVKESNARLRELGPGLVALFGMFFLCLVGNLLTANI